MSLRKKIKQFLRDLCLFIYIFFYILFYVILLFPLWHLIIEMRKARRNERGNHEVKEGC